MNTTSLNSTSDSTPVSSTTPSSAPTTVEEKKIVNITIPLPNTEEELEQLLYRYRAILNFPKENAIEINAIERLLNKVSKDQDEYLEKLETLRSADVNYSTYDESLLQNQILALQLLGRDMPLPDNLLNSLMIKDNDNNDIDMIDEKKEFKIAPIEISLDFKKTAEQFGLQDKFTNICHNKLGKSETEDSISKRIAKRIGDLERLPANLGTYSLDDALEFSTKDDIPSSIDQLKIRALIELKSYKILTKQKQLRQKLINSVSSQAHHNIPYLRSSPFTLAAQRSVQVRPKVIVPQTVRLAEELERQQLFQKRKKERNLHLQKVNSVLEHIQERQSHIWPRRDRCIQFGKILHSVHNTIEKEEQKRVERTAKQRLAALKSNDEEAYLKLLDQTKDTRITQLLKQTNTFLDSLAQAVRVQQNEAKLLKGEEITPISEEEREKIDYYEVAHTVKEKVEKQPSILTGGTLKEYQLRGLEWMVSLYNNNLNGILADEMGLGKTIQSLSLITYLYEVKKDPGPYLVIVPLSTITNWTLEFEKWAPTIRTIVYKGTPNQRRFMQPRIRASDFDVLLTTYEYIIKDRALLSKHDWTHMIIDEGHRMKNAQSKLSYTITHYYRTKNRLILTGTPLQNNLPELWALLNFVLPKIFNSAKTFDEWFNTPFANTGTQEKLELTEEETLLIIRRLHKVLRPFLLRRLKKEVEKDLPDKVEKVIKCKLSGLQQQLYEQMLKHNALFVGAGTEGATKGGIKGLNNKIMQLRKICNHPFVFDEVESVVNPTRSNNSLLYRVSGKFELLDRVLPKLKASGHRVLMFFQMTQVMDIMEDFLRMKELKYMRLDGATKAEDRTDMLKEFNAPDSDIFCFLLSTRAGGLGLNLQTADTVIIFDTDWNPHQDLQAQDRAHRIGQKNEVRILRLITTDSVEEVILERAMQKLDIDGKVIQAGKFDNKSTAAEQEEFLRKLIESESHRDTDDNAEMDDEELNEVLARSDEEKILFNEMDKERVQNETTEAKKAGLKEPLPRLIKLDELPTVFTENIEDHLNIEPVAVGRVRERKKVYYDDGLTEEQFLKAVEDEEHTLEEAIQKKRERRKARGYIESDEEHLDEAEKFVDAIVEDNEDTYEPVVEEVSPSKRSTRKSKRTRSSDKEDKTEVKEEVVINNVEEPPKKKLKIKFTLKKKNSDVEEQDEKENHRPGRRTKVKIKKSNDKDSTQSVEKPNGITDKKKGQDMKVTLKKKTNSVDKNADLSEKVDELITAMRTVIVGEDEHACSDVFEKLPSRRDYPDYYKLIVTPIAIDTIKQKAKKKKYNELSEIKDDLKTMYDNARFYNEEDSWVYNDANRLESFTDEWFNEN